MIETRKVLTAKIIERKNAEAKLVGLYPHISKKQAILYMVQLPTTEDLRDYQFPSLVAATNKQRDAVSNFIDSLDLAEPNEEERVDPKTLFNPALQYFAQCITDKVQSKDKKTKT